MAKDNAQSSFQRGVMSLLILSLLDQEDMYGYQIVQEIAARSGGTIVTQEGSLYPVLYKLQDQGMISGEKVSCSNIQNETCGNQTHIFLSC